MTWRENPPENVTLPDQEAEDDGGEPATKDDEFAREDAPEQEYEDD